MATLPHHDVQSRGTRIYLAPAAKTKPVAKRTDVRPSAIQRMTFIFGASTMLWLGIAAAVTIF